MSVAHDYSRLHQAIDRLSPAQADALYVVAEVMLGTTVESEASEAERPPSAHRLSFTGAGSGPSDLAERAEEYLRATAFRSPPS